MLQSELLLNHIGSDKCVCGSNNFKLKEQPFSFGKMHVALRCLKCGTWIKWVQQESVKDWKKVEPADEIMQGELFK